MMNKPTPMPKSISIPPAVSCSVLRTGFGVLAALALFHPGPGRAQVLQAPGTEEIIVVQPGQKPVDLRRALLDVRDINGARGSRALSAEERVTLHQQWRAAMRGAYRDGEIKSDKSR
jgi:hypothetical protein